MSNMNPETPRRAESFDCDGAAELVLCVGAGRIEVRAADVPRVHVELSGQAEADANAVSETEIAFSEQRRRLVVRAPRSLRRARLALVVEAPAGSRLSARAGNGSITATGELAGLDAVTHSGDVTADRIAGQAQVQTASGNVRLGQVGGRLRASSGSGELEIASFDGEAAKLSAGRGDVWLGAVRSDVRARTGRGSVVIAEAAGGRLDLATGSGDVRVAVRPGVVAEIDLASGSGHARSELDVETERPAESPPVRIRARTGSGNAVVTSASPKGVRR
jgi:hypothetical protein